MRKIATLSVLFLLIGVFFVCAAEARTWYVPKNFPTIQEAWDGASDGDTIIIGPGAFYGATANPASKAVNFKIKRGTIINDGPAPWGASRPFVAGFFFPGNGLGSGTSFIGLEFKDIEFPIFSRGANDITVRDCKMNKAIQGITDWHGQNWRVFNNRGKDLQTSNGGGIGVLIGANSKAWQGKVTGNWVIGNQFTGILYVMPGDGGAYNATCFLEAYNDVRYGTEGADEISQNIVAMNKCSMKSDNPSVVDIVGVELTDTRTDTSSGPVIFLNFEGFNEFPGMPLKIDLTPDNLCTTNIIMDYDCSAFEAESLMSLQATEVPLPKPDQSNRILYY